MIARAVALALICSGGFLVPASAEGGSNRARVAPHAERLRAGAAVAAFQVPDGTPLAGYGSVRRRLLFPDVLGRYPHAFWFAPHDGELDPPAARALVLDDGRSRLVWATVDLIAVDGAFVAAAGQRLAAAGVRPGTLIVSASHTHSGPGAFLDSRLMAILATDRYEEAVRGALVDAVVEAARRAEASKAPAQVGVLAQPGPRLTESRLGQPLDPDVVVLKFVSPSGTPVALLWNYAIHGTMLGARNHKYSGDVMGIASRELERRLGVPALFVNGAVGDVSPRGHGHAAALADGHALAAAVEDAWARARPASAAPLAIGTTRVELPAPYLSLRNCSARWVPRGLTLSLDRAGLPRQAELIGGAVGGAAWVTVPGELQTRLGRSVKETARAAGVQGFVAGVSNDYLGYFLVPEDYARVTYVACASLYGPEAGALVTRAASDLIRALSAGTAQR